MWLHHTFGDDQERGKANLYKVNNDRIAEFNSNEVHYVRVAIRGGNLLISHLLLIMKTRNWCNAGTDNRITLTIEDTNINDVLSTSIKGPHKGKADFYFIPVEGAYQPFTRSVINSITLSAEGCDAWQPEMFFLFGLDELFISMTPLIAIDEIRF